MVMPVRARKPQSARVWPTAGLPAGTAPTRSRAPQRHLQVLDDLRPLVGTAEHGTELPGLVVLELEDRARLVVVRASEEVELAHAVDVLDHSHSGPCAVSKVNFVPTPGRRVSLSSEAFLVLSSVGGGKASGRFASTPSSG